MKDGMITVQVFSQKLLAEMARDRLAAEGITAWIEADNAGSMRPDLELTRGVGLLVQATEAVQALEILRTADVTDSGPSWTCRHCGETCEPQFAVCWQCGQPRG